MNEMLNILILEDSPADAELVLREVRAEGIGYRAHRVETEDDFRKQLLEFRPGLILSDYGLPSYDGMSALAVAQNECPDVPFILVSGTMGEETAVEALKLGATDYILKHRLIRLGPAVRRALHEATEKLELKRAEAELADSESRLRLALWAARLGTFDWDVPNDRIEWSRWHEELWGFAPGEFEGTYEAFASRVHPDDLPEINVKVERCIATRDRFSHEFRVVWPDKSVHWISGNGEFEFDSSGKPIRMLGAVMDITESKRVDEALRESERSERAAAAMQSATLNALPAHIALLDAQGMILSVHEAWERFAEANLLQGSDFSVGQNYLDVCNRAQGDCSEEAEDVARGISSVLCGEAESFALEYPCHSPAEKRWYRLMVTPLHEGRLSGVVVMHVDITERMLADEALRASEMHLRAIFDTEPECVKMLSANGSLLEMNPAGLRMIEADTFQQVENHCIYPLVVEAHREAFQELNEKVFSGEEGQLKFQIVGLKGRRRWLETHASPLRNDAGEVIATVGITRDITERLQAEDALSESEERLGLLFNQMRDGFYYSTHDGPLIDVNPAMVEMFGYSSKEEMLKVDVARDLYFSPEDRMEHNVDDGTETSDVFKMRRKDGSTIWVEDRGQHKYNADGNIESHQGILRDVTERIRAEQELRLQAAALQSAANAITITDKDGTIQWVNPAFTALTGYAPEEAAGRSTKLLKSGTHDRAFYEELWNTILSGQVWRGEMTNRRKDGSIYQEEQTITPVRNDAGEIINFIAVKQDITERKQAEEAIRESEERYRNLFDNNPFPMWAYDLETLEFLAVNDAATFSYGYSRDEFLAKTIKDIRPEYTVSALLENVAVETDSLQGPNVWKHRKKDGSVIDVEITSHVLTYLGRPARLVLANDVTERKRAQQELRRSQENYRDLVENAHDIIYTHDLAGNYTSVNSAVEQILGYTVEEAMGMNHAQSVVPSQVERAREMIARKLNGDGLTAYELDILAKDGHVVTVEVNTKLIFEDGRPVGVQGIARDITERNLLEEQLRQSQKLESVGRLAGGIAHDFNNMLTVINGYSDLALRQLGPDEPLRHNVEEVRKAGERASLLTGQLLAFSRKQILYPQMIQINAVVNETSNMLKRLIGGDVELVTVLSHAVGSIKFDPGQLSQIVINLAVNARDAMPAGGKLTIETSNVFNNPDFASKHIGILPGAYVMLAVSDTGKGMTPEVQAKIFEPFFTTKGVGEGTGLGLAMVYGIVKQSGGTIIVYSEVGHGTTFKIYLPRVADESETPVQNEDMPAELARGSETVLLVEDEEIVRSLSRQVLEECGYTVIEACDGLEALKIYDESAGAIDLLITDVVMPRLGGRELAEKLLALNPDLPALFASGYTDNAVVGHGILEANVNFIQKPFSLDDVARKVRDLLDMRKK